VALAGRCACGAISFRADGEPGYQVICKCRDCQRFSGTGHSALAVFRRDDCTIEGELSFYPAEPAAEGSRRGFCGKCGSPIANTTPRNEEIWMFHAGAFDDPSFFEPQKTIFSESGYAWDSTGP
jgi:hypothetical protein